MSLLEKTLVGAKKGLDYFTFADGLFEQQQFHSDAAEIGNAPLEKAVLGETLRQWFACAGLQAGVYVGLIAHYSSYFQSRPYMGNWEIIGTMTLPALLATAAEAFRCSQRHEYFLNAGKRFDAQTNALLNFPPEVQKIIGTSHDADHQAESEPSRAYERDANWWRDEQ